MGIHPAANRKRITAMELLQMAESYGLHGSEIPFDILKSSDADEAAEYARVKGRLLT
jgi:3-oxoisoapionate decarboxylase